MVSVTVSAALYLTGTSPGKGREGTREELSFSKASPGAGVQSRGPGSAEPAAGEGCPQSGKGWGRPGCE